MFKIHNIEDKHLQENGQILGKIKDSNKSNIFYTERHSGHWVCPQSVFASLQSSVSETEIVAPAYNPIPNHPAKDKSEKEASTSATNFGRNGFLVGK